RKRTAETRRARSLAEGGTAQNGSPVRSFFLRESPRPPRLRGAFELRASARPRTSMKVPLVDLRASLEPIRAELLRGVEEILDGMGLFLGQHVQHLEQEFTAFCEAQHGVAVSN